MGTEKRNQLKKVVFIKYYFLTLLVNKNLIIFLLLFNTFSFRRKSYKVLVFFELKDVKIKNIFIFLSFRYYLKTVYNIFKLFKQNIKTETNKKCLFSVSNVLKN